MSPYLGSNHVFWRRMSQRTVATHRTTLHTPIDAYLMKLNVPTCQWADSQHVRGPSKKVDKCAPLVHLKRFQIWLIGQPVFSPKSFLILFYCRHPRRQTWHCNSVVCKGQEFQPLKDTDCLHLCNLHPPIHFPSTRSKILWILRISSLCSLLAFSRLIRCGCSCPAWAVQVFLTPSLHWASTIPNETWNLLKKTRHICVDIDGYNKIRKMSHQRTQWHLPEYLQT